MQKKKRSLSNKYGQVLGTVSFRYNLYYNFVYSPFIWSSPLNRLLIPSVYFNLPRLPIGFYCSVKLLSHLLHFVPSLKPTLHALCSYPYTSAFYLHPFDHIPPSKPFFSRSLGIYLFNTLFRYPDAPHSISKKEKVPYRSIRFSATASEGQLFFSFPFFLHT